MSVKQMTLRLPASVNKLVNGDEVKTKLSVSDHAEMVLCLAFAEAENEQLIDATFALAWDYGTLEFMEMARSFVVAHFHAYKRAKAILKTIDIDLDAYLPRVERFKGEKKKLEQLNADIAEIKAGTYKKADTTRFETEHKGTFTRGGIPLPKGVKVLSIDSDSLPELMRVIAKAVGEPDPTAGKVHKCVGPTSEFDLGSKH